MIDNGDVLRWSEPVEQSYQNAVDRLIVNISRHLKSGKAIHTAKWETQKLSEMGQLTAENAKIINDALKQMPQQMRDALDDTAKESLKLVDEAIEEAIKKGAVERSPISSTQGVIDELSQQALDQFNLVNTTMLQSTQKAYLKAINDTVMWENQMLSAKQKEATLETLNDATTAVLSGGETRQVALRRAIKELNDHGLYGFVDKAGRHWSPEAYVNMCMRTTVHNVAVRSVRGRQEEYGSSIFQCSYHPASRTEHYPFQNKFYDWNGQSGTFTDGNGQKHKYESVTVTGYGTAAGLFGINCGHLPLPQIPGVTIPTDPDMQSPERDEKDYKESQIQRRLERNIRQSKRLVDAYKAAGDDKGAEEAMDAVRMDQAKMREFIARTGRHRRYDREQISGYGPDKLNRPKKKPTPKPEPPKPKKPTFTPLKNKADAEAYAHKFAEIVNIDGISLKNMNQILEQLEVLTTKYPIKKLDLMDNRAGNAIMKACYDRLLINGKSLGKTLTNASNVYAEIQKQNLETIKMLKEQWEGEKMPPVIQKKLKRLESQLKYSRWGVNESYEDHIKVSVSHEYGHILSDQYFGLINENRANPHYNTDWKLRNMKKQWEDARMKAIQTGDIHRISEYASANVYEFFAESFAAYEQGEKLPDYVESLMKEVIENGIM